jgi:hypothetical protein
MIANIGVHILLEVLKTRVARCGTVRKQVICENCNARYGYDMRRTVTLAGFSTAAALEQQAEARLQQRLYHECEAVPCPGCGWYQRDMVSRLRRGYLRRVPLWIFGLALWSGSFFVAAMIVAVAAPNHDQQTAWLVGGCSLGGVLCAAAIVAGFVCRVYRWWNYNPNPVDPQHDAWRS